MGTITRNGFRLSREQRFLWCLRREDAPPHPRGAVRIEGHLERAALEEAIRHVAGRHSILRTTFPHIAGMKTSLQVVHDDAPLEWRESDLSHLDRPAQEAAIERLLAEEGGRAFDLENGPVARFHLVALSGDRHVLVVTLPALCADARTLENLVGEIARLYEGAWDDPEDEAVAFVQYSEWQHGLRESEDAQAGRAYWRERNLAAVPAWRLPLERVSGRERPFAPDAVEIEVGADVFAGIGALAKRREIPVASVLLACWHTLLWRLTGAPEIAMACVYDGREMDVLQEALGPFARCRPIQSRLEEGTPFVEAVIQIDRVVEEGALWQEHFDWEEIPRSGDGDLPAFLDVGFQFQEEPAPHEARGVRFTLDRQEWFPNRFKIHLSCTLRDDACRFTFHFDRHRFAKPDVERLARSYAAALASAAKDPEAAVDELEILHEDDRRELLLAYNDTSAEYPADTCIHHWFEKQAERTPQNTAVVGDETLRYAELNARANRLAHYLRASGVAPGDCVALCGERSTDILVGLLGILKAGGAYVPLSPTHPQARLSHQLEETRARIVLTQESHRDRLVDFKGQVVCLDRDADRWADQPATNPEHVTGPDDPVYVTYTSGSTGAPKGVVILHRNLVNYVHFLCRRLRLEEAPAEGGRHFATVSTITADLGNTCIYPSLVSGGCLHVLSDEVATDGKRFAEYVARRPIDVLKIVPSHFRALWASRPADADILPRQFLILGGEALPWELIEEIDRVPHGCEVINHYGPTETTVGCLTATLGEVRSSGYASATVPIGRPIANTRAYVLDRRLRPVPVGVPGELYIGGAGVARGYLNQPERTAERFLSDPFSEDPEARMYKTGDLVRRLPDGQVEFLGRTDHQVKIRGFRIELEEIEAALQRHGGVRQAVVVAREDEPGNKRLVGYVVADGRPAPSVGDVMAYLHEQLPDYMVPSALVFLDALPLTPNGKIDRKALPAPSQAGQGTGGPRAAPSTPTEELLAEIWAKVLKVEQVGVDDNFFALGGHSLVAMQIIAQIREAFQVDLPLKELFEQPTVRQLAERIDRSREEDDRRQAPPIVPVPRDGELPLSFAQQRLWFLDQLVPGSAFYNVPLAVRLTGDLNLAVLEQAIAEILRRHEVLRTVYKTVEGRPVQVVQPLVAFRLPVVDLRDVPEDRREAEAQRLAAEEAQSPFDLAEGPLLRITLLRLADDDAVLLSTAHHIISDIWSRGVLVREVAVLYDAFSHGRPSPLPDLPVQYADYAHWQRAWLQGEVLDEQLAYWKGKLAGSPPLLPLPTDRPRPAVQSFRGADRSIQLPRELAGAIRDLSRRENVTPFMTLLAAFQTLLHRYTGQRTINVGSPVAGRTRPETQGMLGFFLNTLIFRADVDPALTFRKLLRQVRQTALEAYAHQDVPFEQLVEALQPERDMSHAPLFQVAFVMVNAQGEALELPRLAVRPFRTENRVARHDLTLFVTEGQEGLTATLNYCTDLFDSATIERMLGHFARLLEALVADPEERLGLVPLMAEEEQRRQQVEWNATQVAYPLDRCLHEHFEAQVERTPDAVALVFEPFQLTYRELNRRANRLARHLRRQNVGPEVPVAVCMERSAEMLIGVLAVLKAGGAYVPLDPTYPPERLAFMLQDCGATVLLIQQRLADRWGRAGIDLPSSVRQPSVVCVDALDEALAEECEENLAGQVTADNAAYVIYTSGSTGKPKGVVVSHRAVTNHMLWLCDHFGLGPNDRMLQKTAFSFDACGTELYTPLLVGGRLVLARPDGHQDSGYLARMIVEHEITVLQLVPSLLRVLLEEPQFARGASLRRVICAGEALPAELQRRFAETLDAELHNLYGPTEAAIDVTCWPTPHAAGRPIVPIGRPIANTQVFLLDAYRQLVPVGVPGEVHLGGVNLARGYLNQPALTAQRFVPNPFGAERGSRLYRTGDAARWLDDGNLEFLGRLDQQVKLRGFRIELGEIEAALEQHPAVREAAVVVREDRRGDACLVAYVVGQGDSAPAAGELRAYLTRRLPEYMVPAAVVALDRLPLGPSGKVDRRQLPDPEHAAPDRPSAYVAPRSPIEEKLAELGAQLLRVEKLGVHDNFFASGGHSLLATQFMSRIRSTLEVDLPLRVLFEKPTIAELAEAIEAAKAGGAANQAPGIKPIARDRRRMDRSALGLTQQ